LALTDAAVPVAYLQYVHIRSHAFEAVH